MQKVVHVTSAHPAFDNRIFFKECVSLARAGYETTLIAPHDSNECSHGVNVRGIGKVVAGRLRRTATMVRRAYVAAIEENGDVYHLHDPELISIIPLLRLRGKRVIYDAHEDLPGQSRGRVWLPRLAREILAQFAALGEASVNMGADRVVAATPIIAKHFSSQRTSTVCNYPILDENELTSPTIPYADRDSIVAHPSARLSKIRGVKEMVLSVAEVAKKRPAKLLLAGNIHDTELREKMECLPEWKHVKWLGLLKADQIPAMLEQARIGLVLLHDVPNYRYSLPTKMYEFMASGVPIIASDFAPWRESFEHLGCVKFVDPSNIRQIADAITYLLDHPQEAEAMGEKGRQAVRFDLNWHSEEKKLLALYRNLLAIRRI